MNDSKVPLSLMICTPRASQGKPQHPLSINTTQIGDHHYRWQYRQAHLAVRSCNWILTVLAWVVRRSKNKLDDASNLQIGGRYLVDTHSRRHFDKCTIYSGNQWLLLCIYCDCGSGADICSCNYAKNIWNG